MVISEVTSEQKKPSESNLKSTKKAKDEVKSKMQLPTTTASSASVSQPPAVTSTVSGKLTKSICNVVWIYLVNSSSENGQFETSIFVRIWPKWVLVT